ncbi:DotU family type IV/VI secretion system protein [Serratia liquefaciens]|uniref:DotU family type IV/VI secretion system protein n=1 Tax=Serratia liquefaciens TaxID=614 RepID=UPI0021D22117|nr:DotU family type IV/VI secretion system protein [Serratia liquefaciens]
MNLLNCYVPVFRFITSFVLEVREYNDFSIFRNKCIQLLQQARLAAELHYSPQDCEDADFAVVIWLDEQVLCSDPDWVKQWRTVLLQHHYFDLSTGGGEFFSRLDSIDKDKYQIRMVYLFCLLMGFHGQYAQQDIELQRRISDERQCLPEPWRQWPNNAPIISDSLSFHGEMKSIRKRFRHRKLLILSMVLVTYLIIFIAVLGII